jgi:hypothetical protein
MSMAEVKSSLDWWETFEYVTVAMVIAGVIGESVHSFVNWPKSELWNKRWGRASALVLIVGLSLELVALVKTHNLGEVVIASLEQGAEKLRQSNLEMERAISPRILEQGATAERLKPFADVSFVVISPIDFESKRTAGQIRFILDQAGWKRFADPPPQESFSFFDGVTLHRIDGSNRAIDAANALVSVFKDVIDIKNGYPLPRRMAPPGTPTVVIEVGPKPLPASMQLKPSGQSGIWGNIAE